MMAAKRWELRGELRLDEPMARHTSWRVGGPADQWYRPADSDDLALYLASLPADEPVYWVGLGSNLLVRDGGLRGSVISTVGVLAEIETVNDSGLRVGVGAPCAKVARHCARSGLSGAEFLAGIPGTIGGALAMNAGCFGGETWQHVLEVEVIDRQGRRRWRSAGDYQVGYRHVQGPPGEWFIGALLSFEAGDTEQASARMREYLERRSATQPLGLPNAGSVFRNPVGDHAARLIEQSGLKGLRVGGAQVSEKHANFIINTGTATAADIEDLIALIATEVLRRHGIRLHPEVHILGERERRVRQ